MQTIQVKTGYGYLEDATGNIISKCELPAGNHPLRDGYTYKEVKTKAALDKIKPWIHPDIVRERKIAEEISRVKLEEYNQDRQDAIDRLTSAGEL